MQLDDCRPKADQAARFEEELREATKELAQTHKQLSRLENIVEKYKTKAEESTILLRQYEVCLIDLNAKRQNLEDENTQLKETLRKGDNLSSLRGMTDPGRIDALERVWSDEKRGLELEIDRLKERLKVSEERSARDTTMIATLEERLKDAVNSMTATLDDLDGEDLNDELNTSRKDLYFTLSCITNVVDDCKSFVLRSNLRRQKLNRSSTNYLLKGKSSWEYPNEQ